MPILARCSYICAYLLRVLNPSRTSLRSSAEDSQSCFQILISFSFACGGGWWDTQSFSLIARSRSDWARSLSRRKAEYCRQMERRFRDRSANASEDAPSISILCSYVMSISFSSFEPITRLKHNFKLTLRLGLELIKCYNGSRLHFETVIAYFFVQREHACLQYLPVVLGKASEEI